MHLEQKGAAAHFRLAERFHLYQLVAGISIVVAAFLFVTGVSAQTSEDGDISSDPVEEIIVEADEDVVQEQEPIEEEISDDEGDQAEDVIESPEAKEDSTVTPADLGVEKGDILPDSRWYGFKRFGRSLRETFTFNPVKKAELRLKHASQELIDAEELVNEKGGSDDAIQAAADAMERYESHVQKLQAVTEKIRERKDGGENVDDILKNVLDTQMKHQKVFENMEDRVREHLADGIPPAMLSRIQAARERGAMVTGEMVGAIEHDEDALQKVIDEVLSEQQGSEFKELRNLEVLKRLESHVPEAAREAIRQAEDNAFKRFADELNDLPPEVRSEKFEHYISSVAGDGTRQLEIFDRLKTVDDLPDEVRSHLELAKDIAAQRFQERVEQLDEDIADPALREEFRAKAFARFRDGGADIDKLRAFEDLQARVQFADEGIEAEFEAEREAHIQRFKEAFPDAEADAEQFQALSKQMAENPDPTTFRLIQELEAKVKSDPKKLEFLTQIEREVKTKFIERAQTEGEKFFAEISSNNPQDIAVFEDLQKEFTEHPEFFVGGGTLPALSDDQQGLPSHPPRPIGPPIEFKKFFDQAIARQSQAISEHIERLEDPALIEQFQKRLELKDQFMNATPEQRLEFESRQKEFKARFEERQRFIGEHKPLPGREANMQSAFEERLREVKTPEERQALEAAMRRGRTSQPATMEERYREASPEERNKMDAMRQSGSQPGMEKSDGNRAMPAVLPKHLQDKRTSESNSNDQFCDEQCQAEMRVRFEKLKQETGQPVPMWAQGQEPGVVQSEEGRIERREFKEPDFETKEFRSEVRPPSDFGGESGKQMMPSANNDGSGFQKDSGRDQPRQEPHDSFGPPSDSEQPKDQSGPVPAESR